MHAAYGCWLPDAMEHALPAGLTTRPLTLNDADAVYDLMAREQQSTMGRVDIELADIVGDWGRPSFDLAASTVGVCEGGRLIAHAELSRPERADVSVDIDHLGRGIGTWLAAWLRDLARSRGHARVGVPTPQGSPGDRLMAALGYDIAWTSWALRLPAGARMAERALPTGYAVSAASRSELAAVQRVVADAFGEWSSGPRETLEDFEAQTLGRPGHEDWLLRVVRDEQGEVVAAAVLVLAGDGETWVDRLATRADQRGRGLAQALLVDAWEAGLAHGASGFGLATDTRTGALGLYEKVGLRVTSTWLHRVAELSA